MDTLNKYFGKIIFLKADLREEHSIYVAALSSSFQDGKKQYVLAFVPKHLAIVDRGYLSELQWVNLQTRTMKNGYRLVTQRWDIGKGIENPMFTMVERTENKTRYLSDQHPLEMVLINDPKKKSSYQYHNHMNLLAALATFKCVISILDRAPSGVPISRPIPIPKPKSPIASSSAEYGDTQTIPEPMYRSMGESGRYATIGLSEYNIPTPTPKRTIQRASLDTARRSQPVIDDSFELIH